MDKIRLVQICRGSGRQQVVDKVVEQGGDTWGGAEVPPLLHIPVRQLRWLSAPAFSTNLTLELDSSTKDVHGVSVH